MGHQLHLRRDPFRSSCKRGFYRLPIHRFARVSFNKTIALLYNAYNSENVSFDENALEMLRKRIRISGQQSEFTHILRSFVDDVKSGALNLNNEEFLQNYCIMKDSDTRLKNFFKMLCPWLS